MIRNILVPLDGSAFGERALDWAALVARHSAARLHLAHVRTPLIVADPMLQYTLVDVETPEEAQEYVEQLVRRLADVVPQTAITTALLEGTVAEALCRYAREHEIDLVVMTTHGRGPWAKFWEGSVAETLVRTLPVSTLLLRSTEDGPDRPPPSDGFRHVLMPVDHNTHPDGVGGMAFALARLFGAVVTLLHVHPPIENQNVHSKTANGHADVESPPPTIATAIEATRQRALQTGISVQLHVVPHDNPAMGILTEASRLQCDLIALETRCRTGIARWVAGQHGGPDIAKRHGSHLAALLSSLPCVVRIDFTWLMIAQVDNLSLREFWEAAA